MDKRDNQVMELSSYIKDVDNDVTMMLQSLQWDRKHLLETCQMSSCKHDRNHRMPAARLEDHEKECYLRSLGYSKEDLLLPEPLDPNANTLVKLNKDDIANIIDYAAKIDPGFRRGRGPGEMEPLSLERLQHSYSMDERRALHDAVVSAAPACHDLGELALLGAHEEVQTSKPKSRAEILAELRDMKRRRTKYRVAAKTRNYSDVLRDVIATQMEHYDAQNSNQTNNFNNSDKSITNNVKEHGDMYIKKESLEPDKAYSKDRETRRDSTKEHGNDYRQRSRDETRQRGDIRHRQYSTNERHRDNSRFRENSRDETRYRENSRDEKRHKQYSSDKRHLDRSRDISKERESKYEDNSRNKSDRRSRHDRDGQSSCSERNRDKKNYRTSDRYKDDTRESRKDYKEYRSRDSDVRCKLESYDSHEKSHRGNKHKLHESQQYGYVVHKRIKQEKD